VSVCPSVRLSSVRLSQNSCPGSGFFNLTQPNPTHQTTDRTQPNPSQSENFGPTNQPNPQPNRTPYSQQQTFGHNLDTLFHINIMTVRNRDAPNCKIHKTYSVMLIRSKIQLVFKFWEIFPNHDPTQPAKYPTNLYPQSNQPMDNSVSEVGFV